MWDSVKREFDGSRVIVARQGSRGYVRRFTVFVIDAVSFILDNLRDAVAD
jgi:hypothetical protein